MCAAYLDWRWRNLRNVPPPLDQCPTVDVAKVGATVVTISPSVIRPPGIAIRIKSEVRPDVIRITAQP
jgi:hypothetical protein